MPWLALERQEVTCASFTNHRFSTKSGFILLVGANVSGGCSSTLGGMNMKANFITARKVTAGRVALLVAAGLLVGTTSAHAVDAPTPTPSATAKAPTQFQLDRAAYKTALEAFIANRQATQTQFKATMATYIEARKSFHAARTAIGTTFKAELALAKTAREAALAAATTPEAKLAANNAAKAAVTAATAKRDAAVAALGAAPVKPVKPALGTKPTPPVKPVKPIKPSN